MAFEPIYCADRLEVVNPVGDVGLVTLWTPLRTAKRILQAAYPDIFNPEKSRIAVISNLYGDGMHQMFCNLLYNPQIRYLIAMGAELDVPTVTEIEAFLKYGLEEAAMLGAKVTRIRTTNRLFPALKNFDVPRLQRQLSFAYLGRLTGSSSAGLLLDYLASHPAVPADIAADRIRVEVPHPIDDDYRYMPSNVVTHQVTRAHPLDCWEELVVRTVRFGHQVRLRTGERLELLNTKVVITDPVEESASALEKYGFSLEEFRSYQENMLDPKVPEGIAYTYGNRLRAFFRRNGKTIDALESVKAILRRDPESRHAYISLWDVPTDLASDEDSRHPATPCLVTIFFRRSEGRLTLTATYRSHNLLTAWLQNVYGLMRLQYEVCQHTGMPPGALTVISHSLGIDPDNSRYALAFTISNGWTRDDDFDRDTNRRTLREDPNGYFVVTIDEATGELVAEHRYAGVLVKQYRGDRAIKIERQVIGDMAVSLVSHAMWLSRELAAKERLLTRQSDRRRDLRIGTDS